MNQKPTEAVDRLLVRNFGQIAEADISLGDLTVIVGAQGTGKSLLLQWLKAAIDGKQILRALQDAGQDTRGTSKIVDLIFGVGMASAWRDDTEVQFNGRKILPHRIGLLGEDLERVFFIPAHRAMLISDGWAAPFQKLTADTPVVARIFSQNLFDRFTARGGDRLFPLDRVLKKEYRRLINDAIFHGGTVGIEQVRHDKRLRLSHGDTQLPFMTWTAGQREFTPLLLGLYHLLPPRNKLKQQSIDWVVVEEPEMGLHPHAISVFLLLTLDLLWRGYRVVLATHSPHVLAAIWMLRFLAEHKARWQYVCKAFGVKPTSSLRKVSEACLAKTYKVHMLEFQSDGKVHGIDISTLDPGSDDERIASWGGLTGLSSRFAESVREAANELGI